MDFSKIKETAPLQETEEKKYRQVKVQLPLKMYSKIKNNELGFNNMTNFINFAVFQFIKTGEKI